MKYYINKASNYILFSLLTILLTNCVTQTDQTNTISVSILPQKYLVEQLMGNTAEVNVLIPKGNSPATYSPSPAQVKNLSNSKVYIKIGHIGFEQAWSARIAEINPDLNIYDSSTGISFIHGEDYVHGDHVHKGGIDPHIWTSPKTMLTVLKNTKDILTKSFPEKEEEIIRNATLLEEKINKLNEQFITKCNSFKNKSFYIFHPAYTYLARDYGLQQISIEHKGKEPSAQWLRKLIDNGKALNIKTIFIQEEFDKRNAEIISSELNIPAIQVHPLSEDWEQEMVSTLSKLEKALR